ncbi:uncharacterized protein J4E88_010952 [Alternaria novae-zelandiae]|uniref:uncharacterized protein n=1 Tax=Alternaria novae-zelandiae TaxID=430562 RepID=UPI0020C380CA|nr:uncharacterized protein J4E88_010952 [Alternaria novae-zelandiae]KAI4661504.1 hypothetical protein J4E88_010952 [Alternaria novae-zelandiae]
MSSSPSNNQQAALKMRPVTGAFLLKQSPHHLSHDIKDILEKHGVKLSPGCSQELTRYLNDKLEAYPIPFDPKRPNLQADLDNSARLRDRRAQLTDQGATSETPARTLHRSRPDTFSRFGKPRNINESFMDIPWNDPVSPSMLQPPMPVSVNSLLQGWPLKEKSLAAVKTPTKVKKEQSVKAEIQDSVKFANEPPVKVEIDRPIETETESANTVKPTLLTRGRADDYLDVGEEESSERAPLAITKDNLVKVEDSVGSDVQRHNQIHRTVDSKSPPAPAIKSEKATTRSPKRTLNSFEEMDADAVSFTSDNLSAIKKTRPAVKQEPSPAPAIKVENDTSGFQSSIGSSNSSGFRSSGSGVKTEFQETPDTTYLGESQQTLGRSQSPFSQTQGFPNPFSRSRFGSQSFLSSPGSVTSQTSGRVEINPRRSARLSQAKMTATGSSAPSASAPSAPPAASPTPSSASSLGVKRRRSASLADEVEQVERQGRNKKFVTKEVVAKQREARHNEDARDQKRSSAQRRASVLRRRPI